MKHCKLGDHWADESEFGVLSKAESGLNYSCRKCHAKKQRERRAEVAKGETAYNSYVNFAEVRHPDKSVMRASVNKLRDKYAVNKLLLKAQGLSFSSNCMECYRALENPRTA